MIKLEGVGHSPEDAMMPREMFLLQVSFIAFYWFSISDASLCWWSILILARRWAKAVNSCNVLGQGKKKGISDSVVG